MKEAAAAIEKFTAEQIRSLETGATIEVAGHPVSIEDIDIRRTKHAGVEVETGSVMTVALDTVISPELKNEGLSREFVNRVQNLRKGADLNVSDRIRIVCDTASATLIEALERFSDYIKSETLATGLSFSPVAPPMKADEIEIDDIKARIGIAVAG
jgi:isoleucyl-tRNA synthetase